jgi:hypothetical protein
LPGNLDGVAAVIDFGTGIPLRFEQLPQSLPRDGIVLGDENVDGI